MSLSLINVLLKSQFYPLGVDPDINDMVYLQGNQPVDTVWEGSSGSRDFMNRMT